MKEIIEIAENICESKAAISRQLKGLISQHQFYEEQILSQNQEIKLLRNNIHKQSQKLNHQMSEMDSKLDFILNTIKNNKESISQGISNGNKK
jgi:septin family protein